MNDSRIGLIFKETAKLFNEATAMEAGRKKLNQTYFNVLLYLKINENKDISQRELCKFACVKAPTMSLTLQVMEMEGLITREKSIKDSRKIHVKKTKKGDDLLLDMKLIFQEYDKIMIDSCTNDELEIFYRCVKKMQNALKERLKWLNY